VVVVVVGGWEEVVWENSKTSTPPSTTYSLADEAERHTHTQQHEYPGIIEREKIVTILLYCKESKDPPLNKKSTLPFFSVCF
jgi:hypothetical protein